MGTSIQLYDYYMMNNDTFYFMVDEINDFLCHEEKQSSKKNFLFHLFFFFYLNYAKISEIIFFLF